MKPIRSFVGSCGRQQVPCDLPQSGKQYVWSMPNSPKYLCSHGVCSESRQSFFTFLKILLSSGADMYDPSDGACNAGLTGGNCVWFSCSPLTGVRIRNDDKRISDISSPISWRSGVIEEGVRWSAQDVTYDSCRNVSRAFMFWDEFWNFAANNQIKYYIFVLEKVTPHNTVTWG